METGAICWSLGHRLIRDLTKLGSCPTDPRYQDDKFKTILGWWVLQIYVSCDLNEVDDKITCKHPRHGVNLNF